MIKTKEFVLPDDFTITSRHPHYHTGDGDLPRVGHYLCQSKVKIRKKFPDKRVNREMKTTSEVGLVKTKFASIGVIGPILITRDPNLYQIRELKPIPDLLIVLSREGTQNCPSFIRVEGEVALEITRSSDEDNPVSKSLDQTSDIFNDLDTIAKRETKRNNEKKGQTYMDSPPP
nr:hypothetical protein CFP56_01936 [Quercus suber]